MLCGGSPGEYAAVFHVGLQYDFAESAVQGSRSECYGMTFYIKRSFCDDVGGQYSRYGVVADGSAEVLAVYRKARSVVARSRIDGNGVIKAVFVQAVFGYDRGVTVVRIIKLHAYRAVEGVQPGRNHIQRSVYDGFFYVETVLIAFELHAERSYVIGYAFYQIRAAGNGHLFARKRYYAADAVSVHVVYHHALYIVSARATRRNYYSDVAAVSYVFVQSVIRRGVSRYRNDTERGRIGIAGSEVRTGIEGVDVDIITVNLVHDSHRQSVAAPAEVIEDFRHLVLGNARNLPIPHVGAVNNKLGDVVALVGDHFQHQSFRRAERQRIGIYVSRTAVGVCRDESRAAESVGNNHRVGVGRKLDNHRRIARNPEVERARNETVGTAVENCVGELRGRIRQSAHADRTDIISVVCRDIHRNGGGISIVAALFAAADGAARRIRKSKSIVVCRKRSVYGYIARISRARREIPLDDSARIYGYFRRIRVAPRSRSVGNVIVPERIPRGGDKSDAESFAVGNVNDVGIYRTRARRQIHQYIAPDLSEHRVNAVDAFFYGVCQSIGSRHEFAVYEVAFECRSRRGARAEFDLGTYGKHGAAGYGDSAAMSVKGSRTRRTEFNRAVGCRGVAKIQVYLDIRTYPVNVYRALVTQHFNGIRAVIFTRLARNRRDVRIVAARNVLDGDIVEGQRAVRDQKRRNARAAAERRAVNARFVQQPVAGNRRSALESDHRAAAVLCHRDHVVHDVAQCDLDAEIGIDRVKRHRMLGYSVAYDLGIGSSRSGMNGYRIEYRVRRSDNGERRRSPARDVRDRRNGADGYRGTVIT